MNYYKKVRRSRMNEALENKFNKKVFISYARKDKELVQSFLEAGENRDFELWIDQGDKKPGSDWRQTIKDKINECDGAILFITKNALNPKSPIRLDEIPQFIKRNNDKNDNFQFFPVFLDYVDPKVVKNYTFTQEGSNKEIKLFDRYDIWNPEANNLDDLEHEMPTEMSKFKQEQFWADLNLQMSKALKGGRISQIVSPNYFNSNKAKAKELRKKRFRQISSLVLATVLFGLVLFNTFNIFNNQNNQQTSEVFNIGGSVRLGVLTKGDCFNFIDVESEINWSSYVQYRACDLLHDGEVFFRENQIDFGSNNVSYASLLNLFAETCNNEFTVYQNATVLPEKYNINFYWDMETQALGTKPFDMICISTSEIKTEGSYVEEITGVGIVLPNPGDKYDCEDFSSPEDAQTWFDLYFEDYGDVALLDINNNKIVCDEINSKNSQTDSTTTTVSETTTTTIDSITVTGSTPIEVTESIQLDYELIEELKSDNSKFIVSTFTQDVSANQWLEAFTIIKQFHWKNAIQFQWSGCYFMGCTYKIYLNGVNIGSHEYEGDYYHPNNTLVLKGLSEDKDYTLEIYVVDVIGQTYGPARYAFSGMDWDNDNTFATGDTSCTKIQEYTIYCYADHIKYPVSLSNPEIEIIDRGNDYLFRLNNWEIASRRGWVGYTHILLFVDGKLNLILGNGLPQEHSISKGILGREITLLAFDTFARPGSSYTFRFNK